MDNHLNLKNLKSINYILERDSKDTTYKFALLRAVIEATQYYDHLKKESNDTVSFPLGVLIEKWILYYYPLVENEIPQKYGEDGTKGKTLAFRKYLKKICDYYKDKGGFSFFHYDFKRGQLPASITNDFLDLLKSLKNTITNMPMKYLGTSYYQDYYSIFKYNKDAKRVKIPENLDIEFIIKNFGTFSFPYSLYVVFRYLGSLINGTESIIYQWAKFSVRADTKQALTVEKVLDKLLITPETDRDVIRSKKFFENIINNEQAVECVWSGIHITRSTINIDHILPFSIWKNNDLWNLLPVHKKVNLAKRDKIPSPNLIEKRKEVILDYWQMINLEYTARFEKELRYNLVGIDEDSIFPINFADEYIKNKLVRRLKEKSNFLIETRGYEEWNITN